MKNRLLANPEFCALLVLPTIVSMVLLSRAGVPSPDWWSIAIPPLIFVIFIYISLVTGTARMRSEVRSAEKNPVGFWNIIGFYFAGYVFLTFLLPFGAYSHFLRFGAAK